MKRRIIWIPLVAAAAGIVGFSLYSRMRTRAVTEQASGAVPVSIARPARGDIRLSLSYAGTLQPSAMVILTSKVPGRVERILVKEGESVAKGQELVRVEREAAALQSEQADSAVRGAEAQLEKARRGVRSEELESARASLTQAEKDLTSAEEAYRRAERLYAEGTIAKATLEEADKKYSAARTQLANARRSVQMMEGGASAEDQRMAEASLAAAEAQRDLARLQMGYARVTSPIAGRIARIMIDEGNMAQQSTPLASVVEDDPMILRIPLPETRYEEFSTRMDAIAARATFRALPDRGAFDGSISSISPTIDPGSRTFTVEISVPNKEGTLRPGMYARVEFVVQHAVDALLVPGTAIVTRGGRTGVFLAAGAESSGDTTGVDTAGAGTASGEGSGRRPVMVARFNDVRVGIQDSENAEILEGIGETDLIVVEGNAFLEDGQAIDAGAW